MLGSKHRERKGHVLVLCALYVSAVLGLSLQRCCLVASAWSVVVYRWTYGLQVVSRVANSCAVMLHTRQWLRYRLRCAWAIGLGGRTKTSALISCCTWGQAQGKERCAGCCVCCLVASLWNVVVYIWTSKRLARSVQGCKQLCCCAAHLPVAALTTYVALRLGNSPWLADNTQLFAARSSQSFSRMVHGFPWLLAGVS